MIFAVNLVWVLFLISTMGDQITLCIESRYDPEITFMNIPGPTLGGRPDRGDHVGARTRPRDRFIGQSRPILSPPQPG